VFGGIKKLGKRVKGLAKAPKHLLHSVTHPIDSLKSLPKRIYRHGIYEPCKNLQRGSSKILKALPVAAIGYATGGWGGAAVAGAGSLFTQGKKKGKGGSSGSSGSRGAPGITPEEQAAIDARMAPKSNQAKNMAAYRANRKPVGEKMAKSSPLANRNTPGRLR